MSLQNSSLILVDIVVSPSKSNKLMHLKDSLFFLLFWMLVKYYSQPRQPLSVRRETAAFSYPHKKNTWKNLHFWYSGQLFHQWGIYSRASTMAYPHPSKTVLPLQLRPFPPAPPNSLENSMASHPSSRCTEWRPPQPKKANTVHVHYVCVRTSQNK